MAEPSAPADVAREHPLLVGIAPSIGTVGDAYDNGLMESEIGLYKTELGSCLRRGPGDHCAGRQDYRRIRRDTASDRSEVWDGMGRNRLTRHYPPATGSRSCGRSPRSDAPRTYPPSTAAAANTRMWCDKY